MNAEVVYLPTPLEQAYSLYLVQQVFFLAPNAPLVISGRTAVPFLTQSGVNRMTLRSIWTAADPQNIGTLNQLIQFQLLLRLVSMAQMGILPAEGSAESFRQCATQYASHRLALPIFSNVVIPSHENLLAMYGVFVLPYPSPSAVKDAVVSGFLGNPPAGAPSTVSVDDAFSDLGPTDNAPLPSLGEILVRSEDPVVEEIPMAAVESSSPLLVTGNMNGTDDDDDEFGDFETVAEPRNVDLNQGVPIHSAEAVRATETDLEDDPFGAFVMNHSAQPPMSGMGTTLPPVLEQLASHEPSFAPTVATSFDGSTGLFHPNPPSGHAVGEMVTTDGVDDDEFGSFAQVETIPSTTTTKAQDEAVVPPPAALPTDLEDDPFGAITGIIDQPLPSLSREYGLDEATAHVSVPSQVDDLGGAMLGNPSFDSMLLANPSFDSMRANPSFDSIVVNPSFDGPVIPETPASPDHGTTGEDDDDEDEFGDFQELSTVPPSNKDVATDVPTFVLPSDAPMDDSDPFGAIIGVVDQPLPSLDILGAEETHFHDSVSASPFVANSSPHAFNQMNPSPSFDGSAAVTDATSAQEDIDEFGGFASAVPTLVIQQNDFFASIHPSQSASAETIPSPSSYGEPPRLIQGSGQVEDAFGVSLVSSAMADPSEDFRAFTAPMQHTSDAPSVSLYDDFGGFSSAAPASDGEMDSFGAGNGSVPAAATTMSPSFDKGSDEHATDLEPDDFGDFSCAAPVFVPAADDFGQFEGNQSSAVALATTTDSSSVDASLGWAMAPPIAQDPFGGFPTLSKTIPSEDPFGILSGDDAQIRSFDASSEQNVGGETGIAVDFGFDESPPDTNAVGVFSEVSTNFVSPQNIASEGHVPVVQQVGIVQNEAVTDVATSTTGEIQTSSLIHFSSTVPSEDKSGIESDHFGDFTSFASGSEDNGLSTDAHHTTHDHAGLALEPTAHESGGVGDDSFGAFEDAPPSQPVFQPQDQWGTFSSESEALGGELPAHGAVPINHDVTVDDDWGDFEAITASKPFDSVEVTTGASVVEDKWGAISSESAMVDSAIHTGPTESPNHDVINDDNGDDDWGDFEKMKVTTPSDSIGLIPEASPVEDEWGAFSSESAALEFAAFDTLPSESTNRGVESDDDWGDFEKISLPTKSDSIKVRIKDLSSTLTRNLLIKSGRSGEYVELVECYEVNVESNTLLDATKAKAMSDRCIELLEMLSAMDHTSGCMYWNQVLVVVRNEVKNGNEVLRTAQQLSASDRKAVLQPLDVMIAGLRECVRVARFIVAAIGDLLMLDTGAILTPDTMKSTWCAMAILEVALEIEAGWKSILDNGRIVLPSNDKLDDAPSITEIRSDAFARHGSAALCQLTLQPLFQDPKPSTQSRVTWGNKEFMACSANLLANLCPFYSLTT